LLARNARIPQPSVIHAADSTERIIAVLAAASAV